MIWPITRDPKEVTEHDLTGSRLPLDGAAAVVTAWDHSLKCHMQRVSALSDTSWGDLIQTFKPKKDKDEDKYEYEYEIWKLKDEDESWRKEK